MCKRFVIGFDIKFEVWSFVNSLSELVVVPSFVEHSVNHWAIFVRIVSGSPVVGFTVED